MKEYLLCQGLKLEGEIDAIENDGQSINHDV